MNTNKTEALKRIAQSVAEMVNPYIAEPITITYDVITYETMMGFSEWNRKRFRMLTGEECFFISRPGDGLLYVVNVTGDSILTATHELMDLIARKF
jgi:hypothetical protein